MLVTRLITVLVADRFGVLPVDILLAYYLPSVLDLGTFAIAAWVLIEVSAAVVR